MTDSRSATADLDVIASVVARVIRPRGSEPAPEELLDALERLRRLADQLVDWEPLLISAARERDVSWARLAAALGVRSRQAAERRYLRLQPTTEKGLTAEQRLQATRDERAADRAVAVWARDNAAELRQLAGQVSAVTEELTPAGRRDARALRHSLGSDDPAALLGPLDQMRGHLAEDHAALAEGVSTVNEQTARVRHQAQSRRRRG